MYAQTVERKKRKNKNGKIRYVLGLQRKGGAGNIPRKGTIGTKERDMRHCLLKSA